MTRALTVCAAMSAAVVAMAAMMAASVVACGPSSSSSKGASPPASSSSNPGDDDPDRDAGAPGDPQVIQLEPVRVEVEPDGEGGERVVAYDARSLFDEGNDALGDGRYDDALRAYDELLVDFGESALVVPALYNAGLAHEGLGDFDAAARRYEQMVRRATASRDAIDGAVRLAAVLAELERWVDSVAALDRLLARDDLSDADRLQALARLGYALFESGDAVGAEQVLREAVQLYRDREASGAIETSYYAAMAQFYLGEIPRRRFMAIPIRLPDKQIERDVEAKSELILLAHDRYVYTVELENPYWATAATYRLADMRRAFWVHLVSAPIPPALGDEARALYVQQVHKLSAQFLEKALSLYQKNIDLAVTLGFETVWIEASKRDADAVTGILARESTGEIVRPEQVWPNADVIDVTPTDRPAAEYVPARVDL